ncbi:MAG: hypothetical protein HY079_15335 [Elusimicrobia bacterium]|nr:hypothetical protein [Elusimicrobiota bacterium]
MSLARTTRLFRTALAAVLAAALVALAPGLAPYEAAAQSVGFNAAGAASRGPVVAGPAVVPVGAPGGVSAIPSASALAPSLAPGLGVFAAPSAALPSAAPSALTAAPAAAFSPVRAALPALPASALSAAPAASVAASPVRLAAAAAPAAVEAPALRTLSAASDGAEGRALPGVRGELSRATESLDAAKGEAKAGVLEKLFSGVRRYFALDEAPLAAAPAPSAAPVVAAAPLVSAAPALARPALTPIAAAVAVETRATPPSPIVLEGRGLQAGEKFLAAADGPSAKPAQPEPPKGDDWIDSKAVKWMMIQGAISIMGFIATSVAYPLVAIHAVGAASFGVLMALGPLASIATGPLNGFIADKLSPRNGLTLLAFIRGALALALPALSWFGILNFGTLLIASIANGWQLSLLMTSEGAYYRKLAGRNHIEKINTIAALRYLGLQVVLGLIVGIGAIIDHWNPMTPFVVSALLHFVVVAPLIWFKLPNIVPAVKAKAAAAAVSFSEAAKARVAKVGQFFRKFWKELALFGAAVALYLFGLPVAVGGLLAVGAGKGSTLAIAAALLYWVVRTDGFKAVWAQKNLRAVMLLSAGSFGLIYPFQYFGLPLIAGVLGGAAGKGLIYGQLLGALFFGQMIANAGSPQIKKLGEFKIPFTSKKIGADRIVQLAALALGATWTFLRLFPGSWLAAAAAVAVGSVLLWGSSKFTARGWVKYIGLGLSAATLIPLFFWGNIPAIFAAVLALGLFVGPASVALNSYFGKTASAGNIGNAFGASSSLNNAATSFGYGLIAWLVSLYQPAFPGALGPISWAFMAVGAIFFLFGPKLLPGLPEKSFESGKPAAPSAPADKK